MKCILDASTAIRIAMPEALGVKLIAARVKRVQSDYESEGKW